MVKESKNLVLSVELTFTEDLLGTASANPELVREFIASKNPAGLDEDEIDSVPDVDEELQKSTTVFPRTSEGKPFVYDYQVKGFFKDACSMLKRVAGSNSSKIKAHRKIIDGLVFVQPRKIELLLPEGEIGTCQRPIRVNTAQGERVALARSESAPAGTKIKFNVVLLDGGLASIVEEWLDYGKFRGLGCWRNSGVGRFMYTMQ